MELKELTQFIKQNLKAMSAISMVSMILGIAVYLVIPARFIASGSLFISRQVETSPDKYFSYEGYYSQQTAQSYAGTFIALLESTDVKSKALELTGKSADATTLQKLSKIMQVKKDGPQLVNLTVTNWDKDETEKTWKALANSALEFSINLNKNSDPFLHVSIVDNAPIVRTEYKNIFINIVVGYGIGMLLSGVILALRKYLQ